MIPDDYLSTPRSIIADLLNQRRNQIRRGIPLTQCVGELSKEDLIIIKQWWINDTNLLGMKLEEKLD